MATIKFKHIMDKDYREAHLDSVFIEALGLSEGCSCEAEEFDIDLLKLIKKNPHFLKSITDEYKYKVLEAHDYTVKS